MTVDYRNWQILSSGLIIPGQPTVFSEDYTTSYEYYKIILSNISPDNSDQLFLRFNNDASAVYNKFGIAPGGTSFLISGANIVLANTGALQAFIDLFVPLNYSPVAISGMAFMCDPTLTLQTQIIAGNYYGVISPAPNPLFTLFWGVGSKFATGRVVVMGATTRGASTLASSTTE